MVDVVDGKKTMLSLPELARKSDIPESTCRRYISQFPDYFTSSGSGRVKKYYPESVHALQTIKRMYDQGKNKADILEVLTGNFTQEVTIHQPATTHTTQEVGPLARDFVNELMKAVKDHQPGGHDDIKFIFNRLEDFEQRLKALEKKSWISRIFKK